MKKNPGFCATSDQTNFKKIRFWWDLSAADIQAILRALSKVTPWPIPDRNIAKCWKILVCFWQGLGRLTSLRPWGSFMQQCLLQTFFWAWVIIKTKIIHQMRYAFFSLWQILIWLQSSLIKNSEVVLNFKKTVFLILSIQTERKSRIGQFTPLIIFFKKIELNKEPILLQQPWNQYQKTVHAVEDEI